MADRKDFNRRVRSIIIAHNVGGSRYSSEDAIFDIEQAYTENFGPLAYETGGK